MRFINPRPRMRALLLVLALLAVVPTAANAAPKKVRFSFTTSAASVNENSGTYTLRIDRSGNTRVAASVNLAVTGTAVAGTNYTFTNPGTVNFASGETTKTFPVTIIDNSTFDPPNKTIIFTMSGQSPGTAMLQRNPETVTILDNDGPGTIDFGSASYSVVESAGFATVSVTRNGNPMLSVSVHYATSDVSATAGSDYTSSSGTLTFGVGQTTKTFQVPITDDQAFEGDEALTLTLSNPQNLTNPAQPPNLGPSSPAPLTIVDDDVPTFAFDSPTYSVAEDVASGTKTITVTRGGATYVPADVTYSTSDGTAVNGGIDPGTDYTAASGTLHFDAGETTKTFDVKITNDSSPEGNETVNLHLSFQGNEVSTAVLSIVDDDNPLPSVQFSTSDYSVDEADATATLTVTLSRDVSNTVTVGYTLADDTATAGAAPNTDGTQDYVNTPGTVTFLPHETSKTIDVTLNPDTVVEDDETFTATLSNSPTNAVTGSPGTATVTIADDDDFGLFEFSKQSYDVNENGGHVTVTVNRVDGSAGAVSVDYATSDGSAAAPGDYTATSGTLNFADGETSKTFDIPVAWDGLPEGDESISIDLSNPGGGADLGSTATGVVHIADDGASAPVQFSAASYDVAETAGNATITVDRAGAGSKGGPVTVDYSGADGTHGTLTFGPGEASKAFQVPVADDNVHTGSRTVTFTLSNPGGGTSVGARAAAVLNIADNEPASSPSTNPPSSSTSTDNAAPKLTITAKKLQKALKTKKLVFKVKSNEAASLRITSKIRKGKGKAKKVVVVKKASKPIKAGKTITVTLKLNKKALRTLTKALVNGKVKVIVSVKGTDVAKNSATRNKTVTVK
jgi:hypothetical protein